MREGAHPDFRVRPFSVPDGSASLVGRFGFPGPGGAA